MTLASSLHALAFPKRTGAELEAAKPYVRNVYRQLYPEVDLPFPSGPTFQLAHVTVHSIPLDGRTVRLLYAACLAASWACYPSWLKVVTLM